MQRKAHHEGIAEGLQAAGRSVAQEVLQKLQAAATDGAPLDVLENK